MGNTLMGYLAAKNDVRAPHIKPEQNPAPSHKIPNNARFAPQGPAPKGNRFSQGGAIKAPVKPQHSGGSFLHQVSGFFGGAAHDLGSAAAYTRNKTDLAAHDIAAMPAGFVKAGEALGHDSTKLSAAVNRHLGLRVDSFQKKADKTPYQTPALGKAAVVQAKDSIVHPLRDPFQGFLTAAAIASLGAGSAARLGAAGEAANAASDASALSRAGEAAKAFIRKPKTPDRIIQVPKLVEGKKGMVTVQHDPVQFTASKSPLVRAVQHLHDTILERSLNKHNIGTSSLISKYAERRVGFSDSEVARRTENVRQSLPLQINAARKFGKGLSKKEGQLALALKSWNVLPHEARDFFEAAIEHGDHPGRARELSDLAHSLHQKGALVVRRGQVAVNGKMYPELERAGKLVSEGQKARNAIIKKYDLMQPEAMAAREALPAEIMRSEAARSAETGVRTGQGYTPLKLSEKNLPRYPRPGGQGEVKGVPKNFITKSLVATGEGLKQGLVPDNTTAGVARAVRQAEIYRSAFEARARAFARGSDISRHEDDVLVRSPKGPARPLNMETKQALGQHLSTLDTLGEEQSLADRFHAHFDDILHPKQAGSVGVRAQPGTKWVSRKTLGDLSKTAAPRGTFARRVDNLNSWVTGLTVYAKLSHVGQRFMTDATTSAIGGALFSPKTRAFVRDLKHGGLTEGDRVDAAQATGTHGYLALPHEGTGVGARFATSGANFFARHVDARFRFMNLAHEARLAGIDTPAKFKQLLDYAKNPNKRIRIKDAQKYEQVLRRSDRVSMMYDGLTPTERATVSRALWFYPWTKAAFRYGGHVAMEHPKLAAGLAASGVQGREWQHKALGPGPSFEEGLIPLGGGKTSSAGWLLPFNTTSQVVEMGARPQDVIGNLNPAYQAGLTAISGFNSFGDQVPGGRGYPALKAAASELFAPTPEAGILKDYLDAKAARRKTHMFPHNPSEDWLTKLLVGPSYPKKTNKKALHKAAAQERGGLISIEVPKRK